jgi:hypothetical protein
MFNKLPLGLYYELREFLDPVEYYQSLTTTKSLQHVLWETWKIRINGETLFEESTQALLSKIKNPGLQLVLHVPKNLDVLPFLVTKSHEIVLHSTGFMNDIPNWFENLCQFHHSAILEDNFSIISPQQKLGTSCNLQKLHIENCPLLTDVSALSHLNSLALVDCVGVSDVTCLGTVKSSLRLEKCPRIADVSALGRIPSLILNDCPEIRDISQLTDNSKLTILSCPDIDISLQKEQAPHHTKADLNFFHSDIMETAEQLQSFLQSMSSSSFSSLRELFLERYSNYYIDPSHLKNLSVLRLVSYGYFEDDDDDDDEDQEKERVNKSTTSVPLGIDCCQLTHLFQITLDSLPFPNLDLSSLFHVPVVELFYVPIKTLQGLGGNKVLYLSGCDRVEDFSAARNIPKVHVAFNPNLENGLGLEGVEELTIQSCANFQDTSQLGNLKKLRIAFCNSLEIVEGIENVSTVSLIRCRDLSSLSGLGNNDKITITKEWKGLFHDNPRLSSEFYREDFNINYPDEFVLIKKE